MYSIVWIYKIFPENKEIFEFEYGPMGSWSALFRKSSALKKSCLNKNDKDPLTYILIDKWTSSQTYEEFLQKYKESYDQLCSQFEHLYHSEEKIGTFISV